MIFDTLLVVVANDPTRTTKKLFGLRVSLVQLFEKVHDEKTVKSFVKSA